MDDLLLTALPPPLQGGGGMVVGAYKKALATAAACPMLARNIARELLPYELRVAVKWGARFVRARLLGFGERERQTLVIRRHNENVLFDAAQTYLATWIIPHSLRRLSLAQARAREPDGSSGSWETLLCMEPGGTTTVDVFDGVEFTWTFVETERKGKESGPRELLELSFDAKHAGVAMHRYVPFILSAVEDLMRRHRLLRIFTNEGQSWNGIVLHHPSTFDTLAMDPALKMAIVADLDRFIMRREYYRRIGKAWKRGYLLYGPLGSGKSSLVAAMANYLRFNIYNLDLSNVLCNSVLPRLLISMPNKSILVIEDIDRCFDAASVSRKDGKDPVGYTSDSSEDEMSQGTTLSGILNFIDGLWSTCSEERIIIFTTNYKDRLDPALLRPGRMDMHINMGYCGWEAFKTLVHNYFLIDNHALFPEIQALLAQVEVTPAEVSEMLLRSDDAEVALRVLVEFLQETRNEKKRSRDNK